MANKLSKGNFDLEDFPKTTSTDEKVRRDKGILSLMPGVRKAKEAIEKQ